MSNLVAPSINLYFIQNNKLLLSRRKNTGWMDGFLCAPGGHVEIGETPKIAAIREAKEELGINLKIDDLEFLCVAVRNTSPKEYVAYEFLINEKAYEIVNNEIDKCSELIWVDIKNLPNDIIPDFNEIIINSIIDDKKYLEIGFKS